LAWPAREGSRAGLLHLLNALIEGLVAHQGFEKGYVMNRIITNLGKGFTLVELMIALAAISIFLAAAHSWIANYTIRNKIDEALAVADTAKISIIVTCAEDPSLAELSNKSVGYSFPPSLYINDVRLSGSCAQPNIMVLTANTGLLVNPTLTISGDFSPGNRQATWKCTSDGLDLHVPDRCHG
jgi:type IV pilus assembly protein PilA